MEKNSAISLLEKTFKNKFDMDNYVTFLKELFNKSNIHPRKIDYIRKEFWSYENEVYFLGDYSDESGDSIALYVVELTKQSSRDRARTMQRNLISSLIKDRYDSALVAFYESNMDDWRFSHVTVQYEFNENGLKEKLTSPKRHSFLVGPNEPNHTCQKQFVNLLVYEDKISLEEIDEAFSIENVTDEFFNKYKDLFLDLTESLEEVKENDFIVKEEFDSKHIQSSDFAKKLMGQLVFICFLQKKGWLGVKKGNDWGTGPKDFLKRIFNKCINNNENFFNDVLEPLFYKGFSEDSQDDHYYTFGYRIPFLNGGLFEPINNYDWIGTDVILDNEIFENIINTFDLFNFTIKEDEPLEKEVAVDPEMLGKVFENLLEIKDRKSKGAFYTPRYIVHFICQESLISYLSTNSNILEEDLRIFITKGDLAVNSIIRANEEKKKYNGNQYTKIPLPDSIMNNTAELGALLKKVKVVDPAVGSGAFPVGMMNEIVKAKQIIKLLNGEEFNIYDLKRETIEDSLYGVDIELSATDITKLRFWLSLVVDEEDVLSIKALPNLDNHIMCGDSLIDGYDGVKLFDENIIKSNSGQLTLLTKSSVYEFNKLENKKREFFNEENPKKKLMLKDEINDIKWNVMFEILKESGNTDKIDELKNLKSSDIKPFFIWELEFSEIFNNDNPGFDIVIGNPPYFNIDTWGTKSHSKKYLQKYYKDVYNDKTDVLFYFIKKAIDLSKTNVSFIISNAFLFADKADKLRNYILNTAPIYKIVNFEKYEVFDNASITTCMIFLDKNKKDNVTSALGLNEEFYNNKDLVNLIYGKENYFNLALEQNEVFPIKNKEIIILNKKIDSNYKKLGNLFYMGQGMQTGANKVFSFKEYPIEFPNDFIKKRVNVSKLEQFYLDEDCEYVLYVEDFKTFEELPLSVQNYLNSHSDKLKSRADVKRRKTRPWWNFTFALHSNYYHLPKIFSNYRNRTNEFALDENSEFIGFTNTTVIFDTNEEISIKYLLALLNSKVLSFRYQSIGKQTGNGQYEYFENGISKLPIPEISLSDQIPFINLTDSIMRCKKVHANSKGNDKNKLEEQITNLKKELDRLIYNLYGLSQEDILLIESNLSD